jgi:hypothetical protein
MKDYTYLSVSTMAQALCDNSYWVNPHGYFPAGIAICSGSAFGFGAPKSGGSMAADFNCPSSVTVGAAFRAPFHGHVPLTLTFWTACIEGNGECGQMTVAWGDGRSDSYVGQSYPSTGPAPGNTSTHTYNSPGSYTVTLSPSTYLPGISTAINIRVDP